MIPLSWSVWSCKVTSSSCVLKLTYSVPFITRRLIRKYLQCSAFRFCCLEFILFVFLPSTTLIAISGRLKFQAPELGRWTPRQHRHTYTNTFIHTHTQSAIGWSRVSSFHKQEYLHFVPIYGFLRSLSASGYMGYFTVSIFSLTL